MSRNRKYNEIVTSHTQIAQTLANIDKDIDVYRQTCDYKFDAMSYCTNYGLESPFINEFQGWVLSDLGVLLMITRRERPLPFGL